ncbi:NADH dehydrogenase [ubiquinone] 1 alpha subcomplex subunit 2 [Labeo rohita]|uniref:NADH dehydrogenase [ubiquinone] 1 alpha subcomplex subunit 2 n=1 Tax=Labeo rohita TaxID=84645 RepID=A0A498NC16_LABRO|nr:NADH dehydrogenase [ubiquinone] 1 alpha subcomplex subunit 2 [Labeo rohita]
MKETFTLQVSTTAKQTIYISLLEVQSPPGFVIGYVRQNCHVCLPKFTVENTRVNTQEEDNKHYVTLKKANPEFPILIRECSGVHPTLWARYGFGKERSVSLDNMNADQVAKALESVVNAKP